MFHSKDMGRYTVAKLRNRRESILGIQFVEGGDPPDFRISDKHFQIAVSSEHVADFG